MDSRPRGAVFDAPPSLSSQPCQTTLAAISDRRQIDPAVEDRNDHDRHGEHASSISRLPPPLPGFTSFNPGYKLKKEAERRQALAGSKNPPAAPYGCGNATYGYGARPAGRTRLPAFHCGLAAYGSSGAGFYTTPKRRQDLSPTV